MTKKRLLKGSIVVILIAALISVRFFHVLSWKQSDGILKYYKYDDNCMDVIVYGPSRSFCTVNPVLMWDKYGIACVNAGEAGQNIGSTYCYMKETLKNQTPKIMLIELSLLTEIDNGMDGNLYINTINMKWSRNYIENVVYEWSHSGYAGNYAMLKWLIAKFPVFHSRYDELTRDDYQPANNKKSAYVLDWTSEPYETPEACSVTGTTVLPEESVQYLDQMMALAKESGATPVFFVAPHIITNERMMEFNAAEEYIESKGYDFINFNAIYRDIGFDYGTDMRNEGHTGSHVNNSGATKVTEYLTEYLHENYDLPDRRNEAGYEVYESQSKEWQVKNISHQMTENGEDLDMILSLYDPDLYDMAIAVYGCREYLDPSIQANAPELFDAVSSSDIYSSTGFDMYGISRLGNDVTMTDEGTIYEGKAPYDASNQHSNEGIELIVVEKDTGNVVLHHSYGYDTVNLHYYWLW